MYISEGRPTQLGQVPNPDNMPTNPLPRGRVPPAPMPTHPLQKAWCPKLDEIKSAVCFAYAPSEIAISKTEAGHHATDVVMIPAAAPPADVTLACRYLVIRDFGVNWRHVKLAPQREQLFKDWLTRFEADKSLHFRIVGYSDCVGAERNNLLLRRGRARNVFRLLGPSARSRVVQVRAASAQTYLTENSTVAARANNRAVVIEIIVSDPQVI